MPGLMSNNEHNPEPRSFGDGLNWVSLNWKSSTPPWGRGCFFVRSSIPGFHPGLLSLNPSTSLGLYKTRSQRDQITVYTRFTNSYNPGGVEYILISWVKTQFFWRYVPGLKAGVIHTKVDIPFIVHHSSFIVLPLGACGLSENRCAFIVYN